MIRGHTQTQATALFPSKQNKMEGAAYCERIGLKPLVLSSELFDQAMTGSLPVLPASKLAELYTYHVPVLSEDGSCAISKDPAPEKFSLAAKLNLDLSDPALVGHATTARLQRLYTLVGLVKQATQVDWLGIYWKRQGSPNYLLKLAYDGAFSRAEFPLTPEFAKQSANSTVGLSGKAVVFQDLGKYEGPYYGCDSRVRSEFCLPILNPEGEILGIIDAESWKLQHFTDERLAVLCAAAWQLGQQSADPL